ncbi:MAG TPA: PilZ domain-containing protein [Candidatus Sulfotelmatobacter sp.]|nr:PilZ domain-containing protein [Candidatus Sulfotelmatobacter sp.]
MHTRISDHTNALAARRPSLTAALRVSRTATHRIENEPPRNTRRWPRYQVDLPVRIIGVNGILTTPVMARGSDISRAGMALHASLALNPGDMMQLQFPTAEPSRVNAIVRHRRGDLLGLEFLSQLPPDDETKRQLMSMPNAVSYQPPTTSQAASKTAPKTVLTQTTAMKKISQTKRPPTCTANQLFAGLRRKQEEFRQLEKEIELLSVAILLLAEDDSEIGALPAPHRLESANRPWPMQS